MLKDPHCVKHGNTMKLPKGTSLKVVKTTGQNPGNYDLYNIQGLSLGKLDVIRRALEAYSGSVVGSVLAPEILAAIGTIDERQTINGK